MAMEVVTLLKRFALALAGCILLAGAAWAEPAAGDWTGTLHLPGGFLRLNIHIDDEGGRLSGYLISLDQGAANLPLDTVSATADTLTFGSTKVRASYSGRWNPSLEIWDGQWNQLGKTVDLDLRRGAATLPVGSNRPQRPERPFPYREEEVRFDSPAAKLAGTLTLPPGPGPFPAAVLIAGSGRHNRNERILDHQPFLVVSDYLTRRGIAVLRYDKRGTAASVGDFQNAATPDFAEDAAAALAFLRARKDIDPRRTGLIGHSEGGLIAPMIAAKDSSVAFVVLLAGPGVDGEAILLEQSRLIQLADGADPAKVQADHEGSKRLYDLIRSGASDAAIRAYEQAGKTGPTPPDSPPPLSNQMRWLRWFIAYDPAPALKALKMPVLALAGSKDLQVPAAQNLPVIRRALSGNAQARVVELPGLNHLFQTAGTGSPREYGRIEETFAPAALKAMGDFVVQATAR